MPVIRARHFLPGSNARHNSTLILPAALCSESGHEFTTRLSVTMQRVSFEVGRPSWLPPHLEQTNAAEPGKTEAVGALAVAHLSGRHSHLLRARQTVHADGQLHTIFPAFRSSLLLHLYCRRGGAVWRLPADRGAIHARRRAADRRGDGVRHCVVSPNGKPERCAELPGRAVTGRYRLCSGRPRCGSHLARSEEHTSELQSLAYLVCRLLLEKKKSPRPRSEASPREDPTENS